MHSNFRGNNQNNGRFTRGGRGGAPFGNRGGRGDHHSFSNNQPAGYKTDNYNKQNKGGYNKKSNDDSDDSNDESDTFFEKKG
jgi:hypothetical protein